MPAGKVIFSFILCLSINLTIWAQDKSATIDNEISIPEIEERINLMGDECWRLRTINPDSAILVGKQAIALADDYGISHKFPRIYNYVGVMLATRNRNNAVPYFHRALEYSLSNNDTIQLGYAYNNLGDVFLSTGNSPLALQYSENSLEVFQSINFKPGIAYGYINLGSIYRANKDFDLAMKHFNGAREIRESLGDSTGAAIVIWELARTFQDQAQMDMAMELYQESYKYQLTIKNDQYIASCLNGMGDIYYSQEKFNLAEEYFLQSSDYYQKGNDLIGLMDNKIGLSLVYAEENNTSKGLKNLNEAFEIATELGLNTKLLEIHETFVKFYQILQKYKKASDFFDQFIFLYDSLSTVQQFEILNEIQDNFLITQNLSLTKQELEARKIQKKYLIIIIVLMMIIIGVFIRLLWSREIVNRKLEEMNQAKDKLFSVISHDLRSPFNSLIGFNELLLEDLEKGVYKNASKYAGIINISAKEGLRLLTNLLNWSQAQRGRIKFNPENISIEELFNELQDFFDASTNKSRIKLSFSSTIKSNITGDTDILRTVLINLISNAIKYTEDGGVIQVEAQKVSSQIFIRVKDNGTGMDTTTLENLFDKTKITQSTVGLRNEKGTGLGLSICEELINIHNGSIKAESKLGEGSTFEIKFPAN